MWNIKSNQGRVSKEVQMQWKSDGQETRCFGGTDVLTHLHSVRGRKGRILYDRDTGNCRQSWHRSGHRFGQKSTRRCLCREKDKLLKTSPTVQKLQKGSTFQEDSSIPLLWHFFLFSSSVLYCVHCLSQIEVGQVTRHTKKNCIFKGRHLLFVTLYSGWPPEVCGFPSRCTEMEFSKYFWNNKQPQQESKESLLFTW